MSDHWGWLGWGARVSLIGVTVICGTHSCHCFVSYQITQGGPETVDCLVRGCHGDKLKRRKASCTQPMRTKRLLRSHQIFPQNLLVATLPTSLWLVGEISAPQTLTATAEPPSQHGATCGGWSRWPVGSCSAGREQGPTLLLLSLRYILAWARHLHHHR